MSQENKKCKSCDKNFEINSEDIGFYEKIDVPLPIFCPDCRYRQRLVDRNEWSLHKRKCDFTGEDIISIYKKDAPFPVYKQEVWKGDKWDPKEYGREFDFSRSFFEQFDELRRSVPHLALVNQNSVNSEYSNQSQGNKDCYMVSATGDSEKCMYGNWYQYSSFSINCSNMYKSDLCYGSLDCGRCSSCLWCEDCHDCVSLSFCIDCRGSTNCFGCVGLRNKNYYWFNEEISKEEYKKRLGEFEFNRESIKEVLSKVKNLSNSLPRKYYHGGKAFDSTGDYLENTKNARMVFNGGDHKDTAYGQDVLEMNDCLDCTEILKAEHSYGLQGCAFINRSIVLRSTWSTTDSYYCDMCYSCVDCFGCFGLKQGQYCILNKQYSKNEYESLKKKIIDHMKKNEEWGEYFPEKYTPFGYNESVAQIYFPLNKEEALGRGYSWYENTEKREYKPTMSYEDIPRTISETDDSITKETIQCASQISDLEKKKHPECATAFRIVPMELMLHKKLGVPLPEKCFPCRRTDLFSLRNPRRLSYKKCACDGKKSERGVYENKIKHFHGENKCPNDFETSYVATKPGIVYCESCYNSEVA